MIFYQRCDFILVIHYFRSLVKMSSTKQACNVAGKTKSAWSQETIQKKRNGEVSSITPQTPNHMARITNSHRIFHTLSSKKKKKKTHTKCTTFPIFFGPQLSSFLTTKKSKIQKQNHTIQTLFIYFAQEIPIQWIKHQNSS